ncbi:MAG: DNA-processing protein DprA [Bacillota bacterium]|nr:DNA-processing protein DprA [Bacillota bacterium]
MNDFDIWYSMAKIGHKEKIDFLKRFKNTYEIWYYVNNIFTDNNKSYNTLKNTWNKKEIDSIKEKMDNYKICMSVYGDDNYPNKLIDFDDSPAVLYYKGDINKLNKTYSISIVGSRKCTRYGIDSAKFISKELSLYGLNIISGMAKGIDAAAHISAIENGKYTCAVLGCGIDVIYPKENSSLYHQIEESGCLVSEFIPSAEPLSFHFPIRNRIISGLSDIIIVVEAGDKSGSLITARMALDQGKDIYVVPGSIFSSQSRGTNKLIFDGAFPLLHPEDILKKLGLVLSPKAEKKKIYTNTEKKILDILSYTPIHINDIIKTTHIDIKQLYGVLFELQLKNEIINLAGNYYAIVNTNID